jgi:hypothetical protein
MVPPAFNDFFLAVAGASGALVGLLFVAVCLDPERLVGPDAPLSQHLRASTALTAMLSSLILSLIALIPDTNLGWAALSVGGGGLLFVAATLRRMISAPADDERSRRSSIGVLIGFLAVMVLQLEAGIRLVAAPHNSSPMSTVAGAIVASLAIGVNRSWDLVGAASSGMTASIKAIVFGDRRTPSDSRDRPSGP